MRRAREERPRLLAATRSYTQPVEPWTLVRRFALRWPMWSLPKPGYDPETMRAVALAYRRERRAGRLDEPGREVGAISCASKIESTNDSSRSP